MQLQTLFNNLNESLQTTFESSFTAAINNVNTNLAWYENNIEEFTDWFDDYDNSTTSTESSSTSTTEIPTTTSSTTSSTTTSATTTTSPGDGDDDNDDDDDDHDHVHDADGGADLRKAPCLLFLICVVCVATIY